MARAWRRWRASAQRGERQHHGGPDEPQRQQDPRDAVQRDDQPVGHGDCGDRQRAADPDGRLDPVGQRDQRAGERAERQPRPHVGATLPGDRGAQLGHDQPGGQEEQHRHDHDPGDRLGPVLRHRPQRVEHHDRGDQQADGVQPAELPPQLGLFHTCVLGVAEHRGDATAGSLPISTQESRQPPARMHRANPWSVSTSAW